MPELAEVEFYRRRWSAGRGAKVTRVHLHPRARVFRGGEPARIAAALHGATLLGSASAAKQMLFRFVGGHWLGVHLGMSGELRVEPPDFHPGRHDHLVLFQPRRALVFTDPRMFGRIRLDTGVAPPAWWTEIAPPILSAAFTVDAVSRFLDRRQRAPIKAVLLMQERFPGVGNWMADEILWRAAIHPRTPAGSLSPAQRRRLRRECRTVCRLALEKIAGRGGRLPRDLNVNIPRTWLFWHRWEPGGICPRTGQPLAHATIGGRTTCWSPARQHPPARRAR
jgi:formamidopyrimidine-DNA glycosylase